MFLALTLTAAASYESRYALTLYCILSALLLLRFTSLIVEINYSSLVLQEELQQSCPTDLLPIFHKQYYLDTLECKKKYT